MNIAFSKKITVSVLIVSFISFLILFVGFKILVKSDPNLPGKETAVIIEEQRLSNIQLPKFPLVEIETKKAYYDEIIKNDVVILFMISTCDACKNELKLISTSQVYKKGRIFGIMFEDDEVIKKYAQDNDVKFPILKDENGSLMNALDLKYFPANITLDNGKTEKVWLGNFNNEQELISFVVSTNQN